MPVNRKGYRGRALDLLKNTGVNVGDTITVVCDNTEQTGIVMPRYEHANDDVHIVLKLKSGYNVGIIVDAIDRITTVDVADAVSVDPATPTPTPTPTTMTPEPAQTDAKQITTKKRILLLSTGGTIASRIDYRTGAVTPVLSADDLQEAVPELGMIADIDPKVVISEYSENIIPEHWLQLAQSILEHTDASTNQGARYAGVIVAHGTDTMHYTSAFLSFALAKYPIPIVLVGAQRSSDRASSDAATNLIGAARFITRHGGRGTYIVMHEDTSDDVVACHIGTRVRKNHTSRRDAFKTIGQAKPAFTISDDVITSNHPVAASSTSVSVTNTNTNTQETVGAIRFEPRVALDEKVALVKYHPGFGSDILEHIINTGYRAIILEGTGLGHVGRTAYTQIRRAVARGIFVGMTSQCIDGRVRMTVYESGRDLADMGVVPLNNMIPEVALVKAMWAAGNASDADGIKKIMLKNIASEMT